MADTSKSTVAGILDIAAGLMALVGGVILAAVGLLVSGVIGSVVEPEVQQVALLPVALLLPLALLTVLAGIVAVAGGIAAVRRSSWAWTVAGAVAALLCFLPLGIAAVVLTVLAEAEFRQA